MCIYKLRIAGWLLLISLVISISHGFYPAGWIVFSGVLSVCAAVLLFHRLIRIQKIQVAVLSLIGLLSILISEGEIFVHLGRAITANNALITLIISVGFLRLIIKPSQEDETLPKGTKALWKTLIGVHLFGAVINLSAIVIFADRLLKKGALHKTQLMILSRTFGADALWSPFFAAMGAALIYSGGAELLSLMVVGIVMAACSILMTGFHSLHVINREEAEFEGYPMHLESLLVPAVLSILVIIAHYIFPDVSTLILVASVVMLTVIVYLSVLYTPAKVVSVYKEHVENGIANSSSELLLFLSAGLLAVGISSAALSADFHLPLLQFTGTHAAGTLISIVFLAIIGLHPIISISVLGGLLAPLSPDPNLLGLMFLFSWGIGVVVSPLSGINLLLQSRYNITGLALVRMNGGFSVIMLLLGCTILVLYGQAN
jgi:hypothetical protein